MGILWPLIERGKTFLFEKNKNGESIKEIEFKYVR